tara:strand:- start:717 stop:1139 length:423 start_codon:yes stop_codon:yes gene_type:complete
MKLSIVVDDKTVVKDGVAINDLSLSWISSDVWAVQWDDATGGHVEKRDGTIEVLSKIDTYQQAITDHATGLAAKEAEEAVTPIESLRSTRNALLEESDWTQYRDVVLSNDADWKTYRQALRDLPANTSDPSNPTYPTKPS